MVSKLYFKRFLILSFVVCAYFSFVKWDTHSEVTINSTMENSFKTIDTRRLAYVFYITENSLSTLECPLRVQLAALQSTNPRPSIDIVITTTGNLTFSTPYGVKVIQFPHAATSGSYQWRDVFDKLMFSNLVQYDRVVYLEIDTIILRNMDHLFDISPFKIESIAAPRAYWLKQPFFQAGGPLVMDPSSKLISQFDTVLKVKSKKTYPGDMDWLNEEFGNTAILMDGFLALLIAEWMPGDGVFNHFGNSFNMSSKDVKHMAMMVHFIAGHKPWVTSRQGVRKMYPSAPGELYDLYDRWFDLQDIVCRRDEMNEQPAAKDEKTRKNKKKLII